MITVVELPEYLRQSAQVLTDRERSEIVSTLARWPGSGVILKGTGGIRKLRWGRPATGKRSGVRVIYYYHDTRTPPFLLIMFAKGERDNISRAERNELASLVRRLRETYTGRLQ